MLLSISQLLTTTESPLVLIWKRTTTTVEVVLTNEFLRLLIISRYFSRSRFTTKSTHIFEYVIINIKETKNIKGILVLKTVGEFLSL